MIIRRILISLSLLLLWLPTLAHQPRMVTHDAVTVRNPGISQAFYAELHGRPQVYRFQATIPFDLFVQLTVPDMPGARRDFLIRVHRDAQLLQTMDSTTAEWTPFYEPFGGDGYLLGPVYEQLAASPGQYVIEVTSPDYAGKYVLAIGKAEVFTAGDWAKTFMTLPKVKDCMGQSPFTAFFNLSGLFAFIMLALLAILIVSVTALVKRMRRRAQQQTQSVSSDDPPLRG